jgi:hypothetical protein
MEAITMNALTIIAGGSPAAARMATDALRAQQNGSPMAAARAARAARAALEDPRATFTDAERREIATLLESDRDAAPIRFRVSPDERARLEQMASDAGLSISDFIRQKIGL